MIRVLFALLGILPALTACATNLPIGEPDAAVPTPVLEKIADGVWIHKSYKNIEPWGLILSQGLVVDTDDGVLLVDTAWTDEETSALLDLIGRKTGAAPDIAVLTHAHDDKMGGMNALAAAGIGGRAHPFTNADAPARGLRQTRFIILDRGDYDSLFGVSEGGVDREGPVKVFYPGPGHTRDNIVVYHAPAKVLFGGCLIRPAESGDLGNTTDADIANWANAVRRVAEKFPEAEIVIPSHGPMGGRELLDHTIGLAEAAAHAE